MQTNTTFSGLFETTTLGKPTKKVSYNGNIGSKNGKISFGIETNINGVVRRLRKNNVRPQDLAGDLQMHQFFQNLNAPTRKKRRKGFLK
jgi:hypothetical protein